MAIYQSPQILAPTQARAFPDGVAYAIPFSYDNAATITITNLDVIELCYVPHGARVIDWFLWANALGTSPLSFKMGTDEKDDVLFATSTWGRILNAARQGVTVSGGIPGYIVGQVTNPPNLAPIGLAPAQQKLKLTCVATAGSAVTGAAIRGYVRLAYQS